MSFSNENALIAKKNRKKHVTLTFSERLEIIKRLENGESMYNLATVFGVSVGTIKNIKTNKSSIQDYCEIKYINIFTIINYVLHYNEKNIIIII